MSLLPASRASVSCFRSSAKLNTNFCYFCTSSRNNMKLLQYQKSSGEPQLLGAQVKNGEIIELNSCEPKLPKTMKELIEGGKPLLELAKRAAQDAKSGIKEEEVKILAPLQNPDKIVCVGLNYKGHCDEQNKPHPEIPIYFSKFPSTIIGPGEGVLYPPITRALDWEVELVIVIGQKTRNVTVNEAPCHVFGYTIAQDLSARDWQKNTRNGGQWLLGKSLDTFCPLGPCIVLQESLSDPRNLTIASYVNGVQKQCSNTGDMVHDVYQIVSHLSSFLTLLPGDLILTGTPSGVGVFRNPKEFLKIGDVVESEISEIGRMKTPIIEFSL